MRVRPHNGLDKRRGPKLPVASVVVALQYVKVCMMFSPFSSEMFPLAIANTYSVSSKIKLNVCESHIYYKVFVGLCVWQQ